MAKKRVVNHPKHYPTEAIIAALEKHYGLVSFAAKAVGCKPSTIYDRINECPEVKEALRLQRERLADVAESKLRRAIEKGQSWAVLKCLSSLRRDLYSEIARVHLGGDAEAPPIKQEQEAKLSVKDMPLELKKLILEYLRSKKEKQDVGSK